jgi:hypothetical protein
MAQIQITIPDAVLPRVVDAFAATYGYQPTIDGAPNPETKAAFAKRQVIAFIKRTVADREAGAAADAARSTAVDAANALDLT